MSVAIGEKIKRARKAVGLSQKQLGEALRLSDKAVSAYEVGRATPTVDTLKEIGVVTHKPVSYFLNDSESDELELELKLATIEKELAEIKKLLKKS